MFNHKICFKCLDNVIYFYREQKITYNKLLLKRAHKNKREITTSTDAKFIVNHVKHLAKLNTCVSPLISFIYSFRSFYQFANKVNMTSIWKQ